MPKFIVNIGIVRINKNLFVFLFLFLTSLISWGEDNQHKHFQNEETPGIMKSESLQDTIIQKEYNVLPGYKTYTIGKNTLEGTLTKKDSIAEIVASGTDFWGTQDEGYFVFKQIKGDFEFSTRVHSLSTSDLYTKAGIMARSDLSDNSKHIYFLVFPDNQERNNNNGGCEFQYRTKRGGESQAIYPNQPTTDDKFNVDFPETWIKLKREGDSFTSYISHDNINWYPYTSHRQKMPKNLLVGLAVTSHNTNGYTKAEFSEIELTQSK